MRRFTISAVLAAGLAFGVATTTSLGQGVKPFRIGTGGGAVTSSAIGGIIARSVSNPPALVVSAVASNGSIADVDAISRGQLESALSQADVVYWAFTGTEAFEGKPKAEELRAIANLYPDSIHLVVRKGAGISAVGDLRGKRVSLDERESGTAADARLVLAVWGVKETDLRPEYINLEQTIQKMKDGALDAFFHVGGYPTPAIAELAAGSEIDLVPIDGANAEKLRGDYKFLARDEIPANTYKGVAAGVRTLSVGALWITSAKVDAEIVYQVTKGLWSARTRQALDADHPKGKAIQEKDALIGVGIPIHAGAEKFYREAGLLK